MYVGITLVSPGAFPDFIATLRPNLIIGLFASVAGIFYLGRAKLGELPETYLGLGLLFSSVLSMAATGWFGGALTTLLGFGPIIIIFFFIAVSCTNLLRVKLLVVVMALVGFFILAQCYFADSTGNFMSPYLLTENVGEPGNLSVLTRYRGIGVLSDPNDLAQLLVTTIPLLFLWWRKGHFASNLLFTIIPAGVLATGIYLTHSRGGAIALVAIILFGFKDKLGFFGSGVVAASALGALLALNVGGGRGLDQDDGGRVGLWSTGLTTLKSHPILGVGPGNFINFSGTSQTAHNSFILGLVELGAIGYFFWLGMIVAAWFGLTAMIPRRKPKTDDTLNTLPHRAYMRGSRPALAGAPQLTQPAVGMRMLSASSTPALSVAEAAPIGLGNPAPAHQYAWQQALDENIPVPPEELGAAARIVRISFVGLLVSGFFLSRTYAASLYIMLGTALALKKMIVPRPAPDVSKLMKKIFIACFATLLFLYLFVRFNGSAGR